MTKTLKAVFENGVFRPVESVPFEEGELVEIVALSEKLENGKTPGQVAYGALSAIAALPLQGADDGFSGADHDKILYGGKDGVR